MNNLPTTVPTVVSAFTNDSGYITTAQAISVTQNTASGTGSLTYNSTTGVLTYTPPVASGGGGGSFDFTQDT